jgi:hypothetical protein
MQTKHKQKAKFMPMTATCPEVGGDGQKCNQRGFKGLERSDPRL